MSKKRSNSPPPSNPPRPPELGCPPRPPEGEDASGSQISTLPGDILPLRGPGGTAQLRGPGETSYRGYGSDQGSRETFFFGEIPSCLVNAENEMVLMREAAGLALASTGSRWCAIYGLDIRSHEKIYRDTWNSFEQKIFLLGYSGEDRVATMVSVSDDSSLAGKVWKERAELNLPAAMVEGLPPLPEGFPNGEGPLLAIPIQSPKFMLGVMFMGRGSCVPETYEDRSVRFASSLAHYLFLALENMRFSSVLKSAVTSVNRVVRKQMANLEATSSVVSRLNETLEKKIYVLSALKELQTSVAPLVDPVEMFHEAAKIISQTLRARGIMLAVPEMDTFFLETVRGADKNFLDVLSEQTRQQLPPEMVEPSREWDMRTVDYFGAPAQDGSKDYYFSSRVVIKDRCIAVFAAGRRSEEDFSEEEKNLLRHFSHQFGLYINGALLFVKTKELDDMKSEFINIASHELRTPMASIKSALELFADDSLGDMNAEQKEYIILLQRNVDRLSELINDVLDFSRIESGRIQLSLEITEMQVLVMNAVYALSDLIRKKKAAVKYEMKQGNLSVRCDGSKITQIFINLIGNALNHNDDGVTIWVGAEADRGEVSVWVRDDGKGISRDDQDKIFSSFFQVKKRTGGGVNKGSGLGLAIVKGLVQAHGSEITIQSQPGKGACFSFKLESASSIPWEKAREQTWELENLRVEAQQYQDRVRVRLIGDFEDHACADMAGITREILDSWGSLIVFDLSECEYIASRGIGHLMELKSKAHKKGGNLVLLNISDSIKKVLDPMGLLNFLSCYKDLSFALKRVGEAAAEEGIR